MFNLSLILRIYSDESRLWNMLCDNWPELFKMVNVIKELFFFKKGKVVILDLGRLKRFDSQMECTIVSWILDFKKSYLHFGDIWNWNTSQILAIVTILNFCYGYVGECLCSQVTNARKFRGECVAMPTILKWFSKNKREREKNRV